MGVLVDLAIAIPAAGLASAGAGGLVVRSRLRDSVQLAPGRRVAVPLRWRWSPRRVPGLHRRLQRSCRLVLAATGGPDAYRPRRVPRLRRRKEEDTSILRTTGRALLDQAVRIDLRLVAADRGGADWRRLHLPGLAGEVAAVESSSRRLAQLARAMDDHLDAVTGTTPDRNDRADLLLDAMEAAIADLRREAQTVTE